MPEESEPTTEPENFWGSAPVLPPQPEYQLPPDPATSAPRIDLPPMPLTRDYARWEWRVAASLIDAALLLPGLALIRYGDQLLGPPTSNVSRGLGSTLVYVGSAHVLAFMTWNSVIRQGRQGASLGKSWAKIKVIGEDSGYEIGIARSFARIVLHTVNAIPFNLGYLWPLWDKKNQTFSDKIMHTVVVHPRVT